jgi:acyl-coenzyme A synthetase/AMP-(fatty) acid ligase
MSELLSAWKNVLQTKGSESALWLFPEGKTRTYSDLDIEASAVAVKLGSLFQRSKGTTVAFKIEDRLEWMTVFLGIQKYGAVAMPIDSTITKTEVDRILRQHGANIYVEDRVFSVLSERRNLGFSRAGITLVKLTSGSTATPKAIPFRESEMMADASNIMRTMGIQGNDIQFATIPLGHSYGLGSLVYPLLMEGTPLAFNSLPLPSIIEKEINTCEANVFPTIPAVLKGLARSEDLRLPSSLRTVISAASPLTQEIWQTFKNRFGLEIHNFYGSSETGGIAYDKSGCLLSEKPGAVGEIMDGVTASIAPSGRILVTSKAIYSYKNRRAHKYSSAFLMADYGSIDKGILSLRGRSNRVVKHNGKRIDLVQIEKLLMEHEAIDLACVQYQESRHRVVASITGSIARETFTNYVHATLPDWKRPKILWQTDEIPSNQRGKIDLNKTLEMTLNMGRPLSYDKVP